MKVLRVVPGAKLGDGPHLTHGTKVFTASGEQVQGVTGIVMRGSVKDDVWRAEISCLVEAPEISCAVQDVTTMESVVAREFRLPECPLPPPKITIREDAPAAELWRRLKEWFLPS